MRAFSRIAPGLLLVALIVFGVILSQTEILNTPSEIAGSSGLAPSTLAQPPQAGIPTYFGSLEVAHSRALAPGAGGKVEEIFVEVGDSVEAEQELMRLDTTQLDWNVQRAEIALELARVALLEINEQSSESQLAVAEANLELARADLAKLEAGGASEEEMAAIRARSRAAWARYNEILAGPSESRLQQLRAVLDRSQLAVAEAQRAYDQVKWRDDVGLTPQAANLQRVTIDLTAAQATYNEATQPPRTSDVQTALAAAEQAQHALNELEKGVSEVDLAVGRARVSAAEAAVLRVQELVSSQRSAELRVSQALIGLEEAQHRRDSAEVRAPFTGIVLSLNADEGKMVGAGSEVAVIGDANMLELIVGIPQDQVLSMAVGDPVRITRFGSDDIFVLTTISKIASISLPGKGNSTFPVTIRVPVENRGQFNPGIFVSATFE